MTIGELIYKIKGDDTQLKSTLKNDEKQVQSFGSKISTLGKLFAGALVAKGISVAIGKLKEFGEAASDAGETESKFNAVFKENSDSVRAWAEAYSDSIGRNVNAQLGFLASVQDTLVPLGFMRDQAADVSEQVVTLANDLASFNNLPTEEVVAGITSALVGNTENLRRYGVVATEATIKQEALTSGIIKEGEALTSQQKAQSILNILVKSTTDAQGDLIRTKESAANVTKSLEDAELGLKIALGDLINEGLTPARKRLSEVLVEMTSVITKGKEMRAAFDAQKEGVATANQNLLIYTEELVRLKNTQESARRINQDYAKNFEVQIANLENLIAQEKQRLQQEALQLKLTEQLSAQEKEAAARAAEQQAAREADLAALADAYEKTQEAQIKALESQIAYFESFQQVGRVVPVLAMLKAELADLTKKTEEQAEFISNDGISAWDAYGTVVKTTIADELLAEQALADYRSKELADLQTKYKGYYSTIGSYASQYADLLGQVAAGEMTAQEAVKSALKSTASSLLKMLGQEAFTRAAMDWAAFISSPLLNANKAGSATLWTAAGVGAYTASGLVQGFNQGGIVGGIGSGDTVPAMLTPGEYVLRKDQVDQAIDNQISGGTGSVSVVFNNLLSMGKESEMRQVARKLYPYLMEEQARVGG